MQPNDDSKLATELLLKSSEYAGSTVVALHHLAGDASGRRYIRLQLDHGPAESVVLMLLKGGTGPIAHGDDRANQDEAFVSLASFLRRHGIEVPSVIVAARERQALLVEDVGDVALWHFTFGRLTSAGEAIRTRLGPNATIELYRRAVDALIAIQRVPFDADCIAFRRSMEYAEYHIEAKRFVDHYLRPNNFSAARIAVIEAALQALCEEVASHPRCLMYRDFMPWNIQVRPDGRLALLDFQDMLIGSSAYDIVSLIHDRDADFALGKAACIEIADYYRAHSAFYEGFYRRYHEALLQRYFRLTGQFRMLTERLGNPVYAAWIPGCFRRIGRSLAASRAMPDVLEILSEAVPEVREGADDPWLPSETR